MISIELHIADNLTCCQLVDSYRSWGWRYQTKFGEAFQIDFGFCKVTTISGNKYKKNFEKKADYTRYKEETENPLTKLKFYKNLIEEFKTELMDKISPLLI